MILHLDTTSPRGRTRVRYRRLSVELAEKLAAAALAEAALAPETVGHVAFRRRSPPALLELDRSSRAGMPMPERLKSRRVPGRRPDRQSLLAGSRIAPSDPSTRSRSRVILLGVSQVGSPFGSGVVARACARSALMCTAADVSGAASTSPSIPEERARSDGDDEDDEWVEVEGCAVGQRLDDLLECPVCEAMTITSMISAVLRPARRRVRPRPRALPRRTPRCSGM